MGALLLLVLAGYSATKMGTAFMPDMSSTQMTATISAKEGQEVTQADLESASDEFVNIVKELRDVQGVGAMTGSGSITGSSKKSVSAYILLKEDMKHSNKEIAKMIKDDTSSLNCDISVDESTMDMGSMVGSGINIQIKGDNLDKLQDISKDMVDILKILMVQLI